MNEKEKRAEKIRRDRLEKDKSKDQRKWNKDWKQFLKDKYGITETEGSNQ